MSTRSFDLVQSILSKLLQKLSSEQARDTVAFTMDRVGTSCSAKTVDPVDLSRYFESSCSSLVQKEFGQGGSQGYSELLSGMEMRNPMSFLRVMEVQRRHNMASLKARTMEGA